MKVKRISGPTYVYDNEILTEPTIVWMDDHPPDTGIHSLVQLIKSSSCDPKSHLVVFSCLTDFQEPVEFNHVCIPGPHMFQNDDFERRGINPNWSNKKQIFNFMLNKVRPHRILLAKMVNYFDLDNYAYSMAWEYNFSLDLTHIDSTVDPQVRQHISQALLPKFKTYVDDNFDYKNNHIKVKLNQTQYRSLPGELGYDNAFSYETQLKENLFEPSYVSLISEPIYDLRAVMITEKTTMAIWGGTIPIWVGGWCIPSTMKNMGFDIFDDLIDHSYQNLPCAFDRCYYAIKLNLSVLQDQQLLKEYFEKNKPRFEHNLNLCKGAYLKQYRLKHCEKYPILIDQLRQKNQLQLPNFF